MLRPRDYRRGGTELPVSSGLPRARRARPWLDPPGRRRRGSRDQSGATRPALSCEAPSPHVDSSATSRRDRRSHEGARRPGQHPVRGSARSGGSSPGRAEPHRGGLARSARLLGVSDRAPARRSLDTSAGSCGVEVGSPGTNSPCGTHRAREHACSAPCAASRGRPHPPGRPDPGA